MSHLTPERVVISRNGDVRLRTKLSLRPIFGHVIRDPKNPKRWLTFNRRGLPIGSRTDTRAEAVVQLTEYTDQTVLATVPVAEHIAMTDDAVDFVSDIRPTPVLDAISVVGVGLFGIASFAALVVGVSTYF